MHSLQLQVSLSQTDKSRLDAFFTKVKHRSLFQSDLSIGRLIDRVDSKLCKQV